jgi:rubredoxin
MIYECIICGHEYDEEEEGVLFKDLPDDWECPDCGVKKDSFEAID